VTFDFEFQLSCLLSPTLRSVNTVQSQNYYWLDAKKTFQVAKIWATLITKRIVDLSLIIFKILISLLPVNTIPLKRRCSALLS